MMLAVVLTVIILVAAFVLALALPGYGFWARRRGTRSRRAMGRKDGIH